MDFLFMCQAPRVHYLKREVWKHQKAAMAQCVILVHVIWIIR